MRVNLKCDSTPIKEWGLDSLVYFTLISSVEVSTTGRVFSSFTESTLRKALEHIPVLELRKSLKALEDLGYVEQQGIRIQLGEDSELYGNMSTSNEPLMYEDKISGSLRKLSTARIRGVDSGVYYKVFKRLCSQDKLLVQDAMKYYKCVYFSQAEELPSEFSVKEKGQMGHMIKFYGTGNRLRNMIAEYVINSNKYTKDFISIGGLLFARHKVEAALTKKSSNVIRKGVDHEF